MATRKRSRSNGSTSSTMRRTTSLSELAPPARAARGGSAAAAAPVGTGTAAGPGLSAAHRRHSLDCFPVTETAAFLKACGLCNRRLGPGHDTFIYMGEVAFCSHECRQQQMNLDELMEKKCLPPSAAGSSDQSGNSSTIAAA